MCWMCMRCCDYRKARILPLWRETARFGNYSFKIFVKYESGRFAYGLLLSCNPFFACPYVERRRILAALPMR
jgi:hypothetical protein